MSKHNYDMGVIGNCSYLAHIDRTANVVWQCWPQFDSSFIFGSLLDSQKGGHFYIRPAEEEYESRQYYIENTNILCTEFTSESGKFRVIDFAPRFKQFGRYTKPLMLCRRVEKLEGAPQVRVSCQPRGNYGEKKPKILQRSNHIKYLGLEQTVRLYSDTYVKNIVDEKPFVLQQEQNFILTWAYRLEANLSDTIHDYLRWTQTYWQDWVMRSYIPDFYQEQVVRSALVLKLHLFQDTGAIIASSTTSLPEHDGSGRNWDYRYCWMRDAYYTLAALSSVSHYHALRTYARYVQTIAMTDQGRYQPLYSIDAVGDIPEQEIDLKGYLDRNEPVRIGNQAHEHIQNDVYGQMIVSLLPLYTDLRFPKHEQHAPPKDMIFSLLKKINEVMDEPDAGLWEFRTSAQLHTYTYLFHWAGAKAVLKICDPIEDKEMCKLAKDVEAKSSEYIEKAYDPDRKVYTQAVGSKNLDASLFQLITMNYLDPNSDKAKHHVQALAEELKASKNLFYRYKHKDDFGKPKSAFLICAFWYVEALACVGLVDEAQEAFKDLLEYSNPLGLLSEDIGIEDGSQWGNFPQTYSHVGLMNAAFRIARKLDQPIFL